MNCCLRLLTALDCIDKQLQQPLSLDEICQQAALSKFHFNRLFSAVFALTPMQYVKLLRLKRAAWQLAYRQNSVLEIALDAGYESSEGFSRAFKQQCQQSPLHFRQTPDWSTWQQPLAHIETIRNQQMLPEKSNDLDVEIVTFDETPLAVLAHRGSPQSLPQSIGKFIGWRKANGLPPTKSRTFNLVYDDPNATAPEEYRFDLACEFADIIEKNDAEITNGVIPGGRCAYLRHTGSDALLGSIVAKLYSQWLPQSGEVPRDFPLFFERVRFFPDVPEHLAVTDIYLPIQ